MKVVKISEAKKKLSRLIKEVEDGDEVVIARGNKPVVKLVLVESEQPKRMIGWAKGLIRISDDFNDPIEDFDEYQ